MKKKVNIKKIVLWVLFICTVIYLIRFKDFGTDEKTKVVETAVSIHNNITRPVAVIPKENINGWKYLYKGDKYTWYEPVLSNETTEWFDSIRPTSFESKSNCIVEYRQKNGELNSVLWKWDE